MNRTEKKKIVKIPASILKQLEEAPPSVSRRIVLDEVEMAILQKGVENGLAFNFISDRIHEYSGRRISGTTLVKILKRQ